MYVKIEKNPDGSHTFQSGGALESGWAVVPSYIDIPDSFPFVNIEVDTVTRPSIDGGADIARLEVVSMTEGKEIAVEMPEYVSQLDVIEAQVTYTAMMTDTLLEV